MSQNIKPMGMGDLQNYIRIHFEDFSASDLGLMQYYIKLYENYDIDRDKARSFVIDIISESNQRLRDLWHGGHLGYGSQANELGGFENE